MFFFKRLVEKNCWKNRKNNSEENLFSLFTLPLVHSNEILHGLSHFIVLQCNLNAIWPQRHNFMKLCLLNDCYFNIEKKSCSKRVWRHIGQYQWLCGKHYCISARTFERTGLSWEKIAYIRHMWLDFLLLLQVSSRVQRQAGKVNCP